MPSLQRSTAALSGLLLAAGLLTVGGSPASAETATPAPSAETLDPVDTPAGVGEVDAHDSELSHDHSGMSQLQIQTESALALPDNIAHSDHTYEGTVPGSSLRGASPDGAAMDPLGAGGTLARSGDIKVTLVTLDLADSSARVSMSHAVAAVQTASNFWRSMSNGRLTMSVATKYEHRATKASSTWGYQDIMNQVTAELGWRYEPYKALVVVTPSGLQGGILGYGWSSNGTSGRILLPQISNFTNNVTAHEFGHVLGLMHADSLQCINGQSDTASFSGTGCSIREYGDTSDLMGISRWFDTPAISSSFWDYGGFGRGDEIFNAGIATGRKTYTLKPWAGTSANRAVKFTDPRSREIYYLELRTPTGFDQNLATGGNRGVKVVQSGGWGASSSIALMPSTRPYSGYYASNTAWQQGSVFTTHSGTTVTVKTVSDTAATVTVDAGLPFKDLRTSGFRSQIEWLAASKLSTGWSDGTYRPFSAMNRDAMAAFLYRLAGVTNYTAPATSPFKDVSTRHPYYKQIAWMESSGLSDGYADGMYRPYQPIARNAMAAFLYRFASKFCGIGAAASYTMPSTQTFSDVSTSGAFAKEIAWMKHTAISTGWNDGTYRPLEPITREAMAAFIQRLDGYTDRNGGC